MVFFAIFENDNKPNIIQVCDKTNEIRAMITLTICVETPNLWEIFLCFNPVSLNKTSISLVLRGLKTLFLPFFCLLPLLFTNIIEKGKHQSL